MQLADLDPGIREELRDSIASLYAQGVTSYSDMSHILRQIARDVCRHNGEDVTDGRSRSFKVHRFNIWDVSRGLDDPIAHLAQSTEEKIVTGLTDAIDHVADKLEKFFKATGQPVPKNASRLQLHRRTRSLRNQIQANDGECSFRIRWSEDEDNSFICIVNIGRA